MLPIIINDTPKGEGVFIIACTCTNVYVHVQCGSDIIAHPNYAYTYTSTCTLYMPISHSTVVLCI